MKQWSVYASVLHNSKLNFERMMRMRKKCDIIDEELWFIKKKKNKQKKVCDKICFCLIAALQQLDGWGQGRPLGYVHCSHYRGGPGMFTVRIVGSLSVSLRSLFT